MIRSASLAHAVALPGHLAGSVAPQRAPGKRVLNVRSASLAHAVALPGHLAGSVAPQRAPGKRVLNVRSASLAHAGTATLTTHPSPGSDSTVNEPPARRMRSAMPGNPWPTPRPGVRFALVSKPRPSS